MNIIIKKTYNTLMTRKKTEHKQTNKTPNRLAKNRKQINLMIKCFSMLIAKHTRNRRLLGTHTKKLPPKKNALTPSSKEIIVRRIYTF